MKDVFFKVGALYTRAEIAAQVGGNINPMLVSHGGKVVACCLDVQANRLYPAELLLGADPGSTRQSPKVTAARKFARQIEFIPFFEKQRVNEWKYVGRYRVTKWTEDTRILEEKKVQTKDPKVDIVLYLERERTVV